MNPSVSESIKHHYDVEKRLAKRLMDSTVEERQHLYTELYNELFRSVPDHPQLKKKEDREETNARIESEIFEISEWINPQSVFMELGPGDCSLSLKVSETVQFVYAVDVSDEITKRKYFPDNFKLIISNGSNIPLDEAQIDIVYSNQLMEHLHPDDALEQLKSVFKVLKPGGAYLCITPNRLTGPHDVSKYFDRTATGFHLKEYTAREVAALLTAAGFREIRIYYRRGLRKIFLPKSVFFMIEFLLELLPYKLMKAVLNIKFIQSLCDTRVIGIK